MIAVGPATYDVYFPGDGATKKDLRLNQVRRWQDYVAVTPVRRDSLIGVRWWFEGDEDVQAGTWTARRVKGNAYVCTRLSGDGPVNMDEFDIGYVIRQVRKHAEKVREMGF